MKITITTSKLVVAAGLAAAMLPISAFASTYDWTFASAGLSGSGTLTAVAFGAAGEYDITGGMGSVTDSTYGTFAVTFATCTAGSDCTIVNSDGAGANLTYDNVLFPGNSPGSELDSNGIVLTPGPPGSATLGINIYDSPSQEFYSYNGNGYQDLTTPFSVTLAAAPSATPEPTSLVLVGSGVVGFGIRRLRRNA